MDNTIYVLLVGIISYTNWVYGHVVFNKFRKNISIRLYPVQIGRGKGGNVIISQPNLYFQQLLPLYEVRTCQSIDGAALAFVIISSTAERDPLKLLYLADSPLLSNISDSMNCSAVFPRVSVWLHSRKIFRLLKSSNSM